MRVRRIAVDVAGVIMANPHVRVPKDSPLFPQNYLSRPPMIEAFEVLLQLHLALGGEGIYIITKRGPATRDLLLQWLVAHDFYGQTGIGVERIFYCTTRAEKAGICQELGIDTMIDNRLEVLADMSTVSRRILFRGDPEEMARFPGANRVSRVESWWAIRNMCLARAA